MAIKKAEQVIELKPIDIKEIKLSIAGTTPLIVHSWDEKVKKEMLDKQMGKAKTKKHDIKNPVRDMIEVLTSMCARLYGRRGARNRAMRAVTATKTESGQVA